MAPCTHSAMSTAHLRLSHTLENQAQPSSRSRVEAPIDMRAMRTAMGIIMYQPTLPVRGVTFEEIDRHGFVEFQPTLPVRGATSVAELSRRVGNFNPHSPCGE